MQRQIVTVEFEGQLVSFYAQDIRQFLSNFDLSDEELLLIAEVLAANVECKVVNSCIKIERSNFNDGFYDMEDDLRNQYGMTVV